VKRDAGHLEHATVPQDKARRASVIAIAKEGRASVGSVHADLVGPARDGVDGEHDGDE
jgi:hypothetical protein